MSCLIVYGLSACVCVCFSQNLYEGMSYDAGVFPAAQLGEA